MTLIEYIKQSYQRPNRRILEGLGANECLIEYLMKTSENTNIKVVEALEDSKDGTSRKKADNEFDNLGTLLYYGSAGSETEEPVYISEDSLESGVNLQDFERMFSENTGSFTGIFDGVLIHGEQISEKVVEFGNYLSLAWVVDLETGDSFITVQNLGIESFDHYAIYGAFDSVYRYGYGELYYYGDLQNGIICNSENYYDSGAINHYVDDWRDMKYPNQYVYMVSNNTAVRSSSSDLNTLIFSIGGLETTLFINDSAETGETSIEISNAPSEGYAIYFEFLQQEI